MENDIQFNKTKLALKTFSSTLSQLKNEGILKNYFTEYILIVYYCEFEKNLKKILRNALEKKSTKELSVFISNTIDVIVKRIDKKDIRKTIKYFGKEQEKIFNSFLDKDVSFVEKHQNFITNRHNVAHHQGNMSISWEEVKEIDKIGEELLNVICESLK